MTATPSIRAGLAEMAEGYDAFILDLWGVLHDGLRAYPEAVEGLRRLKAAGKRSLVVSNAPRPTADIAARMSEMGLTPDLYDGLVSSGEEARRHLRERPDPWYRELGRGMYHLGPARDAGMRDGVPGRLVDDVQYADFILNTGLPDGCPSLAPLEPLLRQAADRELPMVCANPDLTVMRGRERELCAGAVAQHYEGLGGEVRYHGKPHRDVYEACFRQLGDPDPARVVAVGDSLRTDVAGARALGLDAVLVAGGIHAEDLGLAGGEHPDPERLVKLYQREGITPTAAIPTFRW